MNTTRHISYVFILINSLYLLSCMAPQQISYQRDVHPIFVDKCIDCHTPPYGDGYRETGLDLESYKSLMEGSIFGPVVIPGNSKMSPLNMFVEGRAGNLSRGMKNRNMPMTDREIKVLQAWVEQGAKNN
jgi:hypothetical protein